MKSPYKWVTFFLLLVLFIFLFATFRQESPCTAVETVNASLKVKIIPGRGMLGFNADTDYLNFGVVSPGISIERKVRFQHSKNASITVTMGRDLDVWTTIIPSSFKSTAGRETEVSFEVVVPPGAPEGEYYGKASFCIKE
ncbi:hypothetical protein HYX13_00180 [Candidatus Woesearchaeota archaeon]|nr:hypothetical protein [Candidatus Woesearchaeota archaeon]